MVFVLSGCFVGVRTHTTLTNCQSASDSAVCRNLTNWIYLDVSHTGLKKLMMWAQAYVQLIVNIGSVLQKCVHHLSVAVLGGGGERRATILPYTRTQRSRRTVDRSFLIGKSSELLPFLRTKGSASRYQCSARAPLITLPLSCTLWRHRIQRGASPPHYDPAGRQKTGRWSLSGKDDKNKHCCLYFKSCTFC